MNGRVGAEGLRPMRKIAWTPEVVVSPEESGGLVTSNGRPNRNIPGTIYYISDTELRGYDLSRGTLEVTNLDTSGIQEAFRFNDLALSDLGQTLAVLDKESYDTTVLRFFSASGNLINSIDASDLVTNAQAFSLQYSPADSNLIAFSYRIIGENNAIAIYDIERERLVDSNYLQNHASVFTWAPDGSLLATDNNLIYRYALLSSGFAAPELLLTLPEVPHSFRVRGSDNRIVYSALGKIYTVGLDGTGLSKVAESVSGESLSSPS